MYVCELEWDGLHLNPEILQGIGITDWVAEEVVTQGERVGKKRGVEAGQEIGTEDVDPVPDQRVRKGIPVPVTEGGRVQRNMNPRNEGGSEVLPHLHPAHLPDLPPRRPSTEGIGSINTKTRRLPEEEANRQASKAQPMHLQVSQCH